MILALFYIFLIAMAAAIVVGTYRGTRDFIRESREKDAHYREESERFRKY